MSGCFIVLEGADGSGKTTQFKLLVERLKAVGHDVVVFDFPRYSLSSSYFIKQYLNGSYGPAAKLNPYTASLFYALDRFEAAPDIRKALAAGKVVISDRFVGSNMAHQGAKLDDPVEQRGFFVWEDSLEYNLLDIPRPSINIFLRVPAEVSVELMRRRAKRSYTDKLLDGHESDLEYLAKTVSTYDTLCKLFPKDFRAIDCTHKGELLSVPQINNAIWENIKPILPRPSKPPKEASVKLSSLQPQPENFAKTQLTAEFSTDIKGASLLLGRDLLGRDQLSVSLVSPRGSSDAKYFKISSLSKKLAERYSHSFEQIDKIGRELNHKLSQFDEGQDSEPAKRSFAKSSALATQPLKPLSTIVDIRLSSTAEAADQLASALSNSSLEEARWLSGQLKVTLGKRPVPFKPRARTASGHEQRRSTAKAQLNQKSSAGGAIDRLETWPRNEFELLPELLYPFSDKSRKQIDQEVGNWTYEQKIRTIKAALAKPEAEILKLIKYRFDMTSDFSFLESMTSQGVISDVRLQAPTTKLGYRRLPVIAEAKLEQLYDEAFELSGRLFDEFVDAGLSHLSGYVVLAGHLNRWQFSLSGEAIKNLLKTNNSIVDGRGPYSGYLALMLEKIQEVHPVISAVAYQPAQLQPHRSRATASKQ